MSLPTKPYNLCDIVNLLDVVSVLDIGCNQGHWADAINSCVPFESIICVDGNAAHAEAIKSKRYKFIHACLSDKSELKKFYADVGGDRFSSGRSIFLENTHHFREDVYEEVQTLRLDDIFPTETFDLIKMDIQGAEYNALLGGIDLIKRAKCLILETATGVYEYNIGSPNQSVLVDWLTAQGFVAICSIQDLPYGNSVAHQDILLTRSEYSSRFAI